MRTRTRASAVAAAMVLATVVLGCSDDTAPSPIAPPPPQTPTAPTPAPAPTIYTVSGVVFEVTSAGNTPVGGVEVYCDPCGPPIGHSSRTTGANGVYSFDRAGGIAAGSIELVSAKRGYVLPNQPNMSGRDGNGWMGSVIVPVSGETHFNIQIMQK